MAYNSNFNTYGGNYMGSGYISPYRPQIQPNQMAGISQMQQPQTQTSTQIQPTNPAEIPITMVRFLKESEGENFVVDLNTKALLIDRQKKVCFVKWCDIYGNSDFIKLKYEECINSETEKQPIDTSNFLTKQDVGEFVKKDDLKAIFDQIANLEKRIKINKILDE